MVLSSDLLMKGPEALVEGWEVFFVLCPSDTVERLDDGAFTSAVSCDSGMLIVDELEDNHTSGDVAV